MMYVVLRRGRLFRFDREAFKEAKQLSFGVAHGWKLET